MSMRHVTGRHTGQGGHKDMDRERARPGRAAHSHIEGIEGEGAWTEWSGRDVWDGTSSEGHCAQESTRDSGVQQGMLIQHVGGDIRDVGERTDRPERHTTLRDDIGAQLGRTVPRLTISGPGLEGRREST